MFTPGVVSMHSLVYECWHGTATDKGIPTGALVRNAVCTLNGSTHASCVCEAKWEAFWPSTAHLDNELAHHLQNSALRLMMQLKRNCSINK